MYSTEVKVEDAVLVVMMLAMVVVIIVAQQYEQCQGWLSCVFISFIIAIVITIIIILTEGFLCKCAERLRRSYHHSHTILS